MNKIPHQPPNVNIDTNEVRRAIAALIAPGQVVEVRALDAVTPSYSRPHTVCGYFNDVNKLAASLKGITLARGIYITLNPCLPDLIARANNRLKEHRDLKTTADEHITARRWFVLDCDPTRAGGVPDISANDTEHQAALMRVQAIRNKLRAEGWPEPIGIDSGNGAYLVYAIDLPAEDNGLIKRVLEGLAHRFNDDSVHIDQAVFNPARIIRLCGTWNCKGDSTEDRPHRMTRLLHVPGSVQVVPIEQLEAVATPAIQEQKRPDAPKQSSDNANRAWALKALQEECYNVRTATVGQRNPRLNTSAFALGQIIGGGNLSRSEVESALYDAAISAGLTEAETEKTLKSGIESGMKKPRTPSAKEMPHYRAEPGATSNGNGHHREPPAEATTMDEGSQQEREDSQALKLVKMAQEFCELFSTSKGEFYARVAINGHKETMVIGERGGAFRRWLINLFLDRTGTIPNATALSSAIGVLEAKAQWGNNGKTRMDVYVRFAHHEGNLYIDLANELHQIIKVTPDGWDIVQDAPVCFRRPDGMLPLPTPVRGGSLDDLRPFVNVADEDWILVKAWLFGALHPTGPYPILDLSGERGSAKTSAAKRLRMVLDPHLAPLRKAPKDDQTFAIMAHNNYIVALDNLSNISSDLSDLMCTLSTGAGDAYRRHYSNDEEVIFSTKRPQVFTGIEELATRGDLIDRCIIVKLPVMDEEKRRDEHSLDREFAAAHPRILGALLDAVSLALRNLPTTYIEQLPRMADFALWVQSAESLLVTGEEKFLTRYKDNRREGIETEIESSPVGGAILAMMAKLSSCDYLTSDLLAELNKRVDERVTKQKTWPKNARALSGALKRLAPSLRAKGIHILQKRFNDGSHITISSDANPSESDANSQKSVANSDTVTQKNSDLRHPENEEATDFTAKVTQSDAKLSTSLLDLQEKREEEGVIKKIPETLRHFASLAQGMHVDSPAGPGVITHITLSESKTDQLTLTLDRTGGPKTFYRDEDIARIVPSLVEVHA